MGSYHHCHVSHLEFGVVLAEITVSTESPLVYRQVCWTSAMIAGHQTAMCRSDKRRSFYVEEFATRSRTFLG